ncbi:long-chain-fatty-acid-CoA ligase [Hyaloscypha variabilis F]|uniref:Long-chain-fatty-acid-CoA ligase n=1 Tax=Hyaloscypha variabilis (strain UAMH 11265 / GT02V1 / F) TaxID=1149755 RepID=A0A2J6R5D1_HYAVF|nr:long-chain-fatty-acid-CoA ligase [Hyaloscypha variabilis F]
MASTLPRLPIFEALAGHDPKSTVVVHSASGRKFTYGELLSDVADGKERLLKEGRGKIDGERIAFLVENSYDYVVTLLSIFGTHSIALPLSPAFPAHELQYIMDHSQASMLLSSKKFEGKALEVMKQGVERTPKHVKLEKRMGGATPEVVTLEGCSEGQGGMMLYTSGTTNRPKGVLLPQSVMTAQAQSLIKAWNYSPLDHLLHVLPLHHIHGTINAVLAPLFAGSTIEFLFPFNAQSVWHRFAAPFLPNPPSPLPSPITFFTVVPTVYNRLLTTLSDLTPDYQKAARTAISPQNLRLNISGSAALPTPTKKAWNTLSSGNVLLERYGMTEVGMALSCGLPFSSRVDGSVGWPLPGVQVRLVDTETGTVIEEGEELDSEGRERDGEIQLRGPTIFKEYWKNPAATKKEHVDGEDGKGRWFKTGDVAVRRMVPCPEQNGNINGHTERWDQGPMYFIRGRLSADIIKSGGEKVSALEVERELLSLPQIAEAAVVAVPSGKWGHKVGAVIILKDSEEEGKKGKWSAMDMRRALRGRLAAYKIPQVMKIVDHIPRNAMGKINKKQLVKAVFQDEASGDEM